MIKILIILVNFALCLSNIYAKEDHLIHIGHSTVLLHLNGLNIIIDPNWNNKDLFLKRITAPAFPVEKLPELDLILISHGHFDHMDMPTLEKLTSLHKNVQIILPEKLGRYLKYEKITNYREVQPDRTIEFKGVRIKTYEAMHDGSRYLIDGSSLSLCYLIKGEKNIFFTGDTGYKEMFKEIGEKERIDTALIMIGGWKIPSFIQRSHLQPLEAVQVFMDLRAKQFIPIHYDTFPLGREKKGESIRLLKEAAQKAGISKKLIIRKFGTKIRL
ncbi:MAG: MBL fold metallo-hydrolase [Spirochaetes bacterium]|nr:MBL fold metallo-hydrolase [Spirochaetota bacterium]